MTVSPTPTITGVWFFFRSEFHAVWNAAAESGDKSAARVALSFGKVFLVGHERPYSVIARYASGKISMMHMVSAASATRVANSVCLRKT